MDKLENLRFNLNHDVFEWYSIIDSSHESNYESDVFACFCTAYDNMVNLNLQGQARTFFKSFFLLYNVIHANSK